MQNQIESRLMCAYIKGPASFETSICISNVFLFAEAQKTQHKDKLCEKEKKFCFFFPNDGGY